MPRHAPIVVGCDALKAAVKLTVRLAAPCCLLHRITLLTCLLSLLALNLTPFVFGVSYHGPASQVVALWAAILAANAGGP